MSDQTLIVISAVFATRTLKDNKEMKCIACNKTLNDKELKLKNKHTGEFEDLCYPCRGVIASAIYYEGAENMQEDPQEVISEILGTASVQSWEDS